jgi:hypothetical protein
MFKFLLILSILNLNQAFAEVGRVIKLCDAHDAYINRAKNKIVLSPGLKLEPGDEVLTKNSRLVFYVHPGFQISMNKNSQILIKSNSVLDFKQGMIRIQGQPEGAEKLEQTINAPDVSFTVSGTEFEVAIESRKVNLDVVTGSVEVRSPHVHTFVPEIVKANEGFTFNRIKKNFSRRKFSPSLKKSEFENIEKLEKEWKEKGAGKS